MLQGGDCAERFDACEGVVIENKLRILLQMAMVITHGGRIPVFHVGRIAGQYAKPRSQAMERVGEEVLPVYRGDLVNALEPTQEARQADPRRLTEAYFCAAATLNHLRALVDGGFDDLHHPERWDIPWEGAEHQAYRATLTRVQESLDFVEALGGLGRGSLRTGEIFISHEALHLPFEEAMTRQVAPGRFTNLGAHMLWVGERTRGLEGAHVEYLRGLTNPIGIKVGATLKGTDLVRLLDRLDPHHEPGRITLITRLGADKVGTTLPSLVKAVQRTKHPVLWSCDPMHGNGRQTATGLKTRHFQDILAELRLTMATHRDLGSRLGAVHFEMTGEAVTECIGGATGLVEADLERAYHSGCDPRLNRDQSLEMAFLVAQLLRDLARKPLQSAG